MTAVHPRSALDDLVAAALAAPAGVIARRADPTAPVPLTAAQSRLWFLDRLGTTGAAFHIRVVLRLTGPVDEPALLGAVHDLARRHEVLRSRVEERDTNQVTVLGSEDDIPVVVSDVAAEDLGRVLDAECDRPFDLSRQPPMRAALFRTPGASTLALTFHHLAVDGWSTALIRAELPLLYAARLGLAAEPPVPAQHTDYAAWTAGERLEEAGVEWWADRLDGLAPLLHLPVDRPRPATAGPAGGEVPFAVPGPLSERIHTVAARVGGTPFMVLLAAWQALLSRMCGTTDVPVGVIEAGRHHPGTENIVGCFVNTVVVRTDLSGDPTATQLLDRVRVSALDALSHADVPFERVVSRLRPGRDAAATPIVQAMFNLLEGDTPVPPFPGLEATSIFRPAPAAKSDLHLTLIPVQKRFTGTLNYRADLFDEQTARDIVSWYLHQLDGLLDDLDQPVAAVPLGPDTAPAFRGEPRERAAQAQILHPLIERWADRTPDAIAVVAPDGRLTYAELDRAANRIAHALLDAGVRPGEPVGVLLEHSVALPAALLGVLKAGAGYLPLDATHPAGRIATIRRTAGARLVVTDRSLSGLVPGRHVLVDELGELPTERPHISVRPEHLLHVIFTSGSTGTPKGVAVEHRNVTDYVDGVLERLGTGTPGTSYAIMSTIAADFAHTCLHAALTTGGTLHLIARDTALDPVALGDYLEREPVDVIKLIPSHFELLAAHGDLGRILPRELLFFAGEALPWSVVERVRAVAPGLRIQNHYGHTESTMVRLVCDVDDVPPRLRTGIVALGRPVANTVGFLAGADGRPVPPGIPGELLVGGPGVARGYLGAAELTEQRFVTVDGHRMYRSGDVLRVRWDGWVEFRGRVDDQVKVRGYRVEPGDVAAALRRLPGVAEAVVLPAGNGLAAWVVPETELDVRELRAGLRDEVPDYMVPASLTILGRLPLTPNGKIDRAALPRTEPGNDEARTPPRTATERHLADVWARILGVGEVGIDDDFFALGGDSFTAVRAVRAGDPGLRVIDMFTRPTVRRLAAHLDKAGNAGGPRLLHRLGATTGATTATLVCVPYGGGSAAVYRPLAEALPDDLAVLAAELPGHDPARPAEAFLPLAELVDRLAAEIEATVTGPVVVYGHSVGAATAVALAQRLEAGGRPVHAVVVGGNFPSVRVHGERWAANRHYRDALRMTGGLLDDLNDDTAESALRAMRHDSEQARAFYARELKGTRRLKAPLLCVIGEADHSTELWPERHREWGSFAERVKLATIPRAGHYFLRHQATELARLLAAWIANPEATPLTPEPRTLRSFAIVAAGQALSTLGYALGVFALGIWAYLRSGEILDLALVTTLATVPTVLLTPLGGTLADRVDRRRVMLTADATSGAAMAALAVLLATDRLTLPAVCAFVGVTAVAAAFHRPAFLAATAQLVPKPYLPRANAIVGLVTGFGTVAGPLAGGALTAYAGLGLVVGLGVLFFGAGVATLLAVRFPDLLFPRQRESFGRALTGGFRFIGRRRPLLLMIGWAAVLNLFASVVFVAVPPLVLSFSGVAEAGLVTTMGGLGAVAGALLMVPWGGTRRRATGMIGAAVVVGAGTIVTGLHPSVPLIAAGLALRMGAMAVLNAHWLSIIQVKVGQQLQGRVIAVNLMLALATQPIGFLAAGLPGALILSGVAVVVLGLLGLAYRPLRRLEDDLPDATPESEIAPDLDAVQRQADRRLLTVQRKSTTS